MNGLRLSEPHAIFTHHQFQFTTSNLASEDLGSWVGIRSWDWPVDVDEDTWVGGLISTWEGNQGSSCLASASSDIDLTASKVDLCTARATSAVKSDMFNP